MEQTRLAYGLPTFGVCSKHVRAYRPVVVVPAAPALPVVPVPVVFPPAAPIGPAPPVGPPPPVESVWALPDAPMPAPDCPDRVLGAPLLAPLMPDRDEPVWLLLPDRALLPDRLLCLPLCPLMPLPDIPERVPPDIPAPDVLPLPVVPALPEPLAPVCARAAPPKPRKTVPAVSAARIVRVFICLPFIVSFHRGDGKKWAPFAVSTAPAPAVKLSGKGLC